MDRKSDRKIRNILLGVVLSFFIVSGMLVCLACKDISKKQMHEMITIRPELENEIKSTFDYYDQQRQGMVLGLVIFLGFLAGFAILMSRVHKNKRDREQNNGEQIHLQELQACLEALQKNNYQIDEGMFSQNVLFVNYWSQIQDTLQSLGYYLSDLREQLAREENSTKALITDISHQLKTSLASLKMSYELSQEETLNEAEKTEFVEKEKREIEKLECLLGELVKLSRLESHMIQVNPTDVPIQVLIAEAVGPVMMKACGKHVEIQIEIPERFPVYVDLKWTAEALVNVLDNAIKYSDEGSDVQLRIQKMPHMVLIEVEDEGIGIPQEELHKIFHRFYRGEKASRLEKDGAGVGLYLARKIIEEQGGTITAKRKPVGTIFRVTFPIR